MFLPVLAAILGILAFLPFNYLWIFGLIFLTPLFIFLIKEEKLWRLILGVFIFRLIFLSGTVYFTLEPITWISSILIFLGLAISIFIIKNFLNRSAYSSILNSQFSILIFLPFLWTFFDHLEARYSLLPTYIITAGNSFGSSLFLELTNIGGLATLTFFAALINILIATIILNFKNKKIVVFISVAIIIVMLSGWQISTFQLQKNSKDYLNSKNSLKIAAISVNEKFNGSQLNQLKLELISKRADLIIFPEDIMNNSVDISFYQNLAKELKTNLTATFTTIQNQKKYNSTVLFSQNGEIVDIHNKNRLTFIGEYWPFGKWRPFFFDWALKTNPEFKDYAIFNPQNAYSAGTKKLLTNDGVPFASLICLEIHYPKDLKEYKKMGALFIANPTSNRWVDIGLNHFLYLTNNLRKIESVWLKMPIISAGVNDFAGIIAPNGKINLIDFEDEDKNYGLFFGEIYY